MFRSVTLVWSSHDLSVAIFLIRRCHSYRWVAVVSQLIYWILAFDQWGSSTKDQEKGLGTRLWVLPSYLISPIVPFFICLSGLYNIFLSYRISLCQTGTGYLSDYEDNKVEYCIVWFLRFQWGFMDIKLNISAATLLRLW